MRPMHRLLILLALVASVSLAGCSKSSTSPPPPPGDTEGEPNDFTAHPLGPLGTSPIVVTGTMANPDVDLFSVTLTATTGLDVSLDWPAGSDLELTLSNSSGIFVRHVNTLSIPESCRLADLPAGNYLIRVGSLSGSTANYTLTIRSF